jgi:hypothetical protein
MSEDNDFVMTNCGFASVNVPGFSIKNASTVHVRSAGVDANFSLQLSEITSYGMASIPNSKCGEALESEIHLTMSGRRNSRGRRNGNIQLWMSTFIHIKWLKMPFNWWTMRRRWRREFMRTSLVHSLWPTMFTTDVAKATIGIKISLTTAEGTTPWGRTTMKVRVRTAT